MLPIVARLVCLLLLSLPFCLRAQIHRAYTRPEAITQYMLKGGWQYSTFSNSTTTAAFKPGWLAGVAIKFPLKGNWWLQPEIFYSRRSAALKFEASDTQAAYEATYSFGFVTYPLLVAYRPNDIFELQLGPQFATILGNEVNTSTGSQQQNISPSELNRWEYAAVAGVEFNVSPLALGIRYAYGLRALPKTALIRERIGEVKLHGLQVYGAVVF